MHTQILILGSGPAGSTAAFYAARAGFKTALLMGPCPGGQLILTDWIVNFPGQEVISGMELTNNLHRQAEQAGVQMIYEQAEQVFFNEYPFRIRTDAGEDRTADSVIIATGAAARWLKIKGETRLIGHGISVCATCDGPFFKNKVVAVIGSGNSAAYEALFLAKICAKVYLIYREKELSAEQDLIQKIKTTALIQEVSQTGIIAFEGEHKLETIVIQNLQTGRTETLKAEGAFEAVGRIPNTQLFKKQVETDKNGYIKTDPVTMATSINGVFACGDAQELLYRQAATAVGSGCRAALSAKKFLLEKELKSYP